jgi:hypothetical protein
MKIILRAMLDDEQEVFINCGDNLDWFVQSDADAAVCVVHVEENGDQHQSLVAKSRLIDIRLDMED